MIDTDTRQPVDIFSINDGLIKEYIDEETLCPIDASSRVKMSKDAKLVRTINTYYNDVDVNGHINSVKYIEHILDLFDLDYYRTHFCNDSRLLMWQKVIKVTNLISIWKNK